jgi:hypothetical protein
MPSNKKLLQAAAGNAGSDPLYVEDVFSTYLYTGNGSTQVIENGIALGDSNYGSSVEFDGVADYVSKNSGLTGQSDSHTFTLSIWVFNQVSSGYARIFGIKNSSGSNNILYLMIDSNNYLNVMTLTDGVSQIQGIDAGNSPPGYTVPRNTWSNILISANLATSTWHLSINDSYTSVTPYKPSGYTDAIAFSTSSGSTVGTLYGSYFKGRITQLYLDNTFRDLSQTSVRRTFINSDGTPATGLASLNPVLYLPLDDTNSVGTNLGTGGAYSVSGSPTQLSEGGPYIESGFGKGGLVWIKQRNASSGHYFQDTDRGANVILQSNTTAASNTVAGINFSFNSDGWSLNNSYSDMNFSGNDYASWTFRKAEKFFDIVTYTGTGSAQNIAHNLGSSVGTLIVKRTDSTSSWWTWHKDIGTNYLSLNTTGSQAGGIVWNYTAPTDSVFTVGDDANTNSATYVAYLFASDAGGFGDDGSESIIKCGSYVGTGGVGTPPVIDLGFEPQWLLVKKASAASGGNWMLMDTMRGWGADGSDSGPKDLKPNTSDAEFDWGQYNYDLWTVNPTGFTVGPTDLYNVNNETGSTFIYIAIRRPMKTPESGTEVFDARYGANTANEFFDIGFDADLLFSRDSVTATQNNFWGARLTGQQQASQHLIWSNATTAETATSGRGYFGAKSGGYYYEDVRTSLSYALKRAPGFFDVVAFDGGGAGDVVDHNLGVKPDLLIYKRRSAANDWIVYNSVDGADYAMFLNKTDAREDNLQWWNDVEPTATNFTTGSKAFSGSTYIAYLFATLAGVSKVGSYTGTGADLNVDCGFSAGARFILIKRTDSTGDWYVYDSARGIVAGNDPYLLLNSSAAEVTSTDYIDPLSSGFTVTSSAPAALNASGGTYIFLSIA